MKDAILLAARMTGNVGMIEACTLKDARVKLRAIAKLHNESEEDAAKRTGLVGWLCYLAREHPPAFAQLLAKVLPLQIKLEANEMVTYRSTAEVLQEIQAMKLPLDRILPLLADMTGPVIDADPVDDDEDDDA